MEQAKNTWLVWENKIKAPANKLCLQAAALISAIAYL